MNAKDLERIFEDMPPTDDWAIKWWQYPFLWALFPLFGFVVEYQSWKSYYVDFRNVIYLLYETRL